MVATGKPVASGWAAPGMLGRAGELGDPPTELRRPTSGAAIRLAPTTTTTPKASASRPRIARFPLPGGMAAFVLR
jgi:hypothetical protein